jgi:hypothetical protein
MIAAWVFADRLMCDVGSEYTLEVCASEHVTDALEYATGTWLHHIALDQDHVIQRGQHYVITSRCRLIAHYNVSAHAVMQLVLETVGLVAWCASVEVPDWHVALEAFERGADIEAVQALNRLSRKVLRCLPGLESEWVSTVASAAAETLYSAHSKSWYWAVRAADTIRVSAQGIGYVFQQPRGASNTATTTATTEARACAYANAYEAARDCMESRALALFTGGSVCLARATC